MIGNEYARIGGSYSTTLIGTYQRTDLNYAGNYSRFLLRLYFVYGGGTSVSSSYSNLYLDGELKKSGSYNYGNGEHFLGEKEIVVYHNADGTFPGYNASISGNCYHFNSSASGGLHSDAIPRYANFTRLDCVGQTVNSIKIAWAADSDCDAVDYNINGGAAIGGNYPEFTVNSLEYNTSYTIKVNIRRSGSGLWTSREINVRTLDKNRFEGAVNNLVFGDNYSFTFRQNAGAATFINILDSNNNKIISKDTKADGTLNNVISYTLNFTQEELDKIYKLYKNGNSIPLKLQLETEYYGARYYDEHTKECILTGNAKTIRTKQNNTLKRGKIYIKQNGQLKKAVVWTKQNNVVKRCM